MALRDKLTARAQPLLTGNDQVRHVFMTQTGMSPYSPIGGALGLFFRKYWIVVATDTQLVVMPTGKLTSTKPKSIAYAVPRQIIDPQGKLWAKTTLGNTTHYIHRRFFKDVQAQDAELQARGVPS